MERIHRPEPVLYEFHVARSARDQYQFDEAIFQFNGNVVFANFAAAASFAQRMNQQRDLVRFPEQAVSPGQISAMGLIDEIQHYIFRAYRQGANQRMLNEALAFLDERFGSDRVQALLSAFCSDFPPLAVYRNEQPLHEWLRGATFDTPHREVALEELLMLWLANANPAFQPFQELFNDQSLTNQTIYREFIPALYSFFGAQPSVETVFPGVGTINLIDLLRLPAIHAPDSLEAQLQFMRERWETVLDQGFVLRMLSSVDVLRDEGRPSLRGQAQGPGVGNTSAADVMVANYWAEFGEQRYDYQQGILRAPEPEPEQFTPDRDWMPRLVLLAKNAFVWLDQLSKRYQRSINTLAEIPDEELDDLKRRGFTGLWLIGLWERSTASKKIKQIMGNPEAVASAYSLYDYAIASDLGGQTALDMLRARCWSRGIRLASDMVPNHVGVDGRWVVEHPDWFVQSEAPPFPSYSFHGPDLSNDSRVGIFIDDHYYDRTDAAVVFQRVDRWTGQTRYIYHGNDGTSMPWNDTAQLNYLNPEVREAVIQTILHVARQFPVIRFDAAMTLAKRHFQRLWFPEPGTGNDIPSRAAFGLTKEQFDAAMPIEFWREVVDRCAVEAPDTLLLAEAFWLMEGYFVRTLGMHRVYNSAFMVLLRDEDNAKYRQITKNTLEFDPEILRRWVNFLNNPDEKTAVEQFGKGDKYFGVTAMMVTMPGLPMFGHGQVEGYSEKYGMEYRRAYYDEHPDQWLIDRHMREIAPLASKRYLFAGVEHFLLYDFFTPEGSVNEDVFAFSNRYGDESSLVIYHNRYSHTRGWIRTSAAFALKTGVGDEKVLTQRTLRDGLALRGGDNDFLIFRDHVAGLEYLRPSREVADQGFYIELGAYKYHVYLNFREVADEADGRYRTLYHDLGGQGVPSIDEELLNRELRQIHAPLRALLNAETLRQLTAAHQQSATDARYNETLEHVAEQYAVFCRAVRTFTEQPASNDAPYTSQLVSDLTTLLSLPNRLSSLATHSDTLASVAEQIAATLDSNSERWATALSWALVRRIGDLAASSVASQSLHWFDDWRIWRIVNDAISEMGGNGSRAAAVVRMLLAYDTWQNPQPETEAVVEPTEPPPPDEPLAPVGPPDTTEPADEARSTAAEPLVGAQLLDQLLHDSTARMLLGVNTYNGIEWFSKEGLEHVLGWVVVRAAHDANVDDQLTVTELEATYIHTTRLQELATPSGYQVEQLRILLTQDSTTQPKETPAANEAVVEPTKTSVAEDVIS
jgi:glycosidase